ncbi:YihY family inner membrane protein [Cobetia marina]|uniref:YihY family inner membrane protein n=1 Tax=Cobetia marina TaxID=28258 RepID=UPI0010AE2E3B|nr:YihY family inner membrane protein [Cobetia marina]TKD63924.1 YihY family inner membrane protein [Cobetia marina]
MRMPQLPQLKRMTPAIGVVLKLVSRFNYHDGKKTASALTYTTLFAVVPLMTVIYSMFAVIPSFDGVGQQLQTTVFAQFLPSTGETVLEYLNEFSGQARNLTSVGLIFLFVTSVLMMITIEGAFNAIWQVPEGRKGLSSFLMYWAVLTLGPLMLGSGFLLSSYLTSLSFFDSAASMLGGKAVLLRLLPPLLSAVAFTFIYAAVPNCKVRLRDAAVGAVTTALALELAKAGFSFYVTQFPSYQAIYGAFAAVPLFLLWVFLSWCIVLLGAEVAAWMGERSSADWHRWPPFWQTLGAVMLLKDAHERGEPLSDDSLTEVLGSRYRRVLKPLIEENIASQTQDGQWVLGRDLNHYTLWELARALPWDLPAGEAGEAPHPRLEPLREALAQARQAEKERLDCGLVEVLPSVGEVESGSAHTGDPLPTNSSSTSSMAT